MVPGKQFTVNTVITIRFIECCYVQVVNYANTYWCLLVHEVCSMSLTDGLSVLLVCLFLLLHLTDNVLTINERLKSTHYTQQYIQYILSLYCYTVYRCYIYMHTLWITYIHTYSICIVPSLTWQKLILMDVLH